MIRRTIHAQLRYALLGGLLLVVLASAAVAQSGNWAEPMFEKLKHDFGVVAKGADTKYRLKISNNNPFPVHIASAGTLCKCATARALQDTIAPGETGYVEIALDTRKFERHRDTTVTVVFDRPQFAEVRIPIDAYIRSDVELTPGKVDFGIVPKGTSVERRVMVAYAGRPDWKIREVLNKCKFVDLRMQEVARQGGMCRYELIATLHPSVPIGEFREQLTLVTDDPASPHIPVLIEGRVDPEYTVSDSLLDFGALPPGVRSGEKKIYVRGPKPFLVEKIESESAADMFYVRLPKEPSKIQLLQISVMTPTDPGTVMEEFTITIVGEPEPVKFKAHVKVVPGTAFRP